MDQRLVAAGHALADFPCEGLSPHVAKLARIADRAFTLVPDLPEFEGMGGACEALVQFLPESRKAALRVKVIGLFDAICELRGQAHTNGFSDAVGPGFMLESPDKWEFLFWNLGNDATQQDRDKYSRFAHQWLPNLQDDVLLEWFGRHGYDSMAYWAHLPLELLHFEEQLWSYEQVSAIQTVNSRLSAVGPGTFGAQKVFQRGDWIGEYLIKHGTWSAPIVVMNHPNAVKAAGQVVPAGMVLIEGHSRLSRLLNLPSASIRKQRHQVMLGTLTFIVDSCK